jgi:hypothetical protein
MSGAVSAVSERFSIAMDSPYWCPSVILLERLAEASEIEFWSQSLSITARD